LPLSRPRGRASRAHFAFIDHNEQRALLSRRPFARFTDLTDLTEVDEAPVERVFEETVQTGWAIAAPVRLGRRPIGSLTVVEGKNEELPGDIQDHTSSSRSGT
jgi:hypothetical protein